uniref:Uncharacterized protein n=1 Tax=Caenorhabditis tropicalis TaxID=1561998 RepID=A0A1I7TG34_9PELO
MGNKEEEFVEEWVQDSQKGSQVPLDHLVSLYGYALLGLEESEETVRFRKIDPPAEEIYEEKSHEPRCADELNKKVEEEYEEPKRRIRVSHLFCVVLDSKSSQLVFP